MNLGSIEKGNGKIFSIVTMNYFSHLLYLIQKEGVSK